MRKVLSLADLTLPGGKQVHLGSFATAEEAALCVARSPEGKVAAKLADGTGVSAVAQRKLDNSATPWQVRLIAEEEGFTLDAQGLLNLGEYTYVSENPGQRPGITLDRLPFRMQVVKGKYEKGKTQERITRDYQTAEEAGLVALRIKAWRNEHPARPLKDFPRAGRTVDATALSASAEDEARARRDAGAAAAAARSLGRGKWVLLSKADALYKPKVGMRVCGKYQGDIGGANWFPGFVEAIHDDGSLDLTYDDGSGCAARHMRPLERPPSLTNIVVMAYTPCTPFTRRQGKACAI